MVELSRRSTIIGMALGLGLALGLAPAARAGDAPNPRGGGTSCVVSGNAYVTKDTTIYAKASESKPIARFSGAVAPLRATRFPSNASQGRVQISAGEGFRLEGFTDARAITIFGSRDLAVVPGHVWISAATPLRFLEASPGTVRVQQSATGGLARPLSAWTNCDALTFSQGTRPAFEMPKQARGYVAKQGTLNLYDTDAGSVIHTLHVSGEGNGLLMWGTSKRRGYVHVTMRSSIFIDAWVKTCDVRALPRGELMDQVVPPNRLQSRPRLALSQFLREMRAPKQVAIYYGRSETTPAVGQLEPNAEVYVLETVVGWATVLPKRLHVLPYGDRAFWVRASALGLTEATPAPTGK